MRSKRLTALILTATMCVGMVACADKDIPVKETETETFSTEQEPETATESQTVSADIDMTGNLLDNGDFHSELSHWGTYIAKGGMADLVAPAGVGKVNIHKAGNVDYSVQVYYDGFELTQGVKYELSFNMYSTIDRVVEARIQINGGDYHAYTDNYAYITTNDARYVYEFEMQEGSDPAPRLCFNLGQSADEGEYPEHTIYISDVCLRTVDESGAVHTEVVDRSVDINLNQVGYLPTAIKTAVVRNVAPNSKYKIVDDKDNVVYEGTLSNEINSVSAGEKVCTADFTDMNDCGVFKMVLEDGRESYSFKVSVDVYDDLLIDSFRFLTTQRCGMEITEDIAGGFAHGACHTGDAIVYGTGEKKHVTGGWHDAGDYGRYVVPGAVTVADLFLAYEDNKPVWDSKKGDDLGIPESGNRIPDILDEAKYELDWMLQMQDETSGGVWHKISCYDFPGFVMPTEENEQLVLAPISNAATADFAAVMAKASTLYAAYDKVFANKCLAAAQYAWEYLEATPVGDGYRNPDEILTGEYPDMRDPDERYWAAIELYKVTKDKKYADYIASILDKYVMHGYGWAQVYSYGNRAYLSMDDSLKNKQYEDAIKNSIIAQADEYLGYTIDDGYMCAVGEKYSWGSNMAVANNARIMLDAYDITKDDRYYRAAYNQLSYLLGQNPMSMSYLTGYGSVYPEHVHHRPSMATGYLLPGMVAGGPNDSLEDPFAKATLAGKPSAKCYADSDQSFSTNEVTIYWNSPFIYLLSYEMENCGK